MYKTLCRINCCIAFSYLHSTLVVKVKDLFTVQHRLWKVSLLLLLLSTVNWVKVQLKVSGQGWLRNQHVRASDIHLGVQELACNLLCWLFEHNFCGLLHYYVWSIIR